MSINFKHFTVSTKENPPKLLLSEINLELDVSKSYLIIGESGSGKTLLARSLAGLLSYHLDSTGLRILTDISENKILYAPQFGKQFFEENFSLEFAKSLFKSNSLFSSTDFEDQFLFYLEKTGLLELRSDLKIPVSSLSMGMKYRLMLVFLFLQKPDFLIVDEPTASLDGVTSQQIIKLLFDYKNESKCGLVIISHENHYFEKYEIELLEMENGYLKNEKRKTTFENRDS